MDEARVGQQGTLTRVWAPRGTRPRALRDHCRTSAYLFGAVYPQRGMGAAVVLPQVNVEAMNIHLAEISRHVTEDAHAVLVLDQAGWHTSRKLRVPENISLLPLPPYAPELNPVEQVWAYLRANFLGHRVWNSFCNGALGVNSLVNASRRRVHAAVRGRRRRHIMRSGEADEPIYKAWSRP